MKLSLLLMRQSWKHSDEPVTPLHQKRLESLMTVSPLAFPLSLSLCACGGCYGYSPSRSCRYGYVT